MKIEDSINLILNEWKVDCEINTNKLEYESKRSANLHAKYLSYRSEMKINKINFSNKLTEYRNVGRMYFQGKLGKDELEHYGWTQYQHVAATKIEAEKKAESLPEVIKYRDIVTKIDIAIENLESIIKAISERGFAIRAIIDLRRFERGE